MSCRLEWKPKKLQRPISHSWRNMLRQSRSLNRRWQERHRYSTHDGCLPLWRSTLFCFNGWCVYWRVCSTFVPCIISRSWFFSPPSVMESQWKPPDWIHLTGWLDQLQIEIRSVEFGLHILPSAPQQLHHQKWFQWSSLIPGESCAAAPLPPALQSSHLEKPRTCGHEF